VLREGKAGALSDDEAIKRLERSPYWVWTAMDPESTLLPLNLSPFVGDQSGRNT
jgi:hypothetical protein